MVKQYSQYLKFIDMRFSNNGGGPFPENSYFAIGGEYTEYPGYDSYKYINLKHGISSGIHCYQGSGYFDNEYEHYLHMLTEEEFINIFYDYYGSTYEGPPNYSMRITWELAQFEAVKKIHNDMVAKEGDPSAAYSGYHLDPYFYDPFNPSEHGGALFPYGTDLSYGVQLELVPHAQTETYDLVGDKIIDGNGYFIDDSPVVNYQRGLTVFYSHVSWKATAASNINSPAVREYWVQVIVRGMVNARNNGVAIDNRLFLDNMSTEYGLVNSRGVEVEYVYPRDPEDTTTVQRELLIKHYARLYASIIKEAQERYHNIYGEYLDFLGNGLYIDHDTHYRNYFLTELFAYAGEYINGGIIETGFNCKLIEKHISRIADFEAEDKKMVFLYNLGTLSLPAEYDSPEVYHMFLFFYLVAQENTYFYVGPEYESSSFNSLIFDHPLGNPIDAVAYYDEAEGLWKREYEKGTIVFDTDNVSGNILNSDDISFTEASRDYIHVYNEEILPIFEDTSFSFVSVPGETAIVAIGGVSFIIKNEDGLFVWDNNSETDKHSFTWAGQNIYRKVGSSYIRVTYNGEGSLLFSVEFVSFYQVVADLINSAQDRGIDISLALFNFREDLDDSEVIDADIDKQWLYTSADTTYLEADDRHNTYSQPMLNFVLTLQEYITSKHGSVNNFLRDNNITVLETFADMSDTVGFPIDAENITAVSSLC